MGIIINGASGSITGVASIDATSINENGVSVANETQLGLKANTADINVANSSLVKTALNASGTAPICACRAWVNFNGTGTVAIRASGNVSSITDNGVGDYTVNFTTAMEDANYFVASCLPDYNVGSSDDVRRYGTPTTTLYRFRIGAGTYSADTDFIGISIFR